MGLMSCMVCGKRRIGGRTNYLHGRKTKSVTVKRCKSCGNTTLFKHPDGSMKRWRSRIIKEKNRRR